MAENISADVNELHCAWYLNGKSWTGGLDATDKAVYDDRYAFKDGSEFPKNLMN